LEVGSWNSEVGKGIALQFGSCQSESGVHPTAGEPIAVTGMKIFLDLFFMVDKTQKCH